METVDLSGLDVVDRAQEGVDMVLLGPDSKPTNVVLRVRGGDSRAFKDKLNEQTRRGVDRGQRKVTEQERTSEFYELYATFVAGWFVNGKPVKVVFWKGGEALEYTPANAALLLEKQPYIFEQVRRFADRRENFLPGPAAS